MKLFIFLALISVNMALLNAAADAAAAAPTPAAAPAPDASAAAATPAAAPAADAGPTITPTQLKWPDTVDLSESAGSILTQNQSTNTLIFKQSEVLIEKMTGIVNDLAKLRADLYAKLFEIDHTVDIFVKNAEAHKGALQQAAAGN